MHTYPLIFNICIVIKKTCYRRCLFCHHHVSLFPLLADCELTWLIFLHSFLSRANRLIEPQSLVFDQEGILSLHLCLGFPRLLLPSTIPSKQSLDKPTDDLLTCPNSFRVLLLILSKREGKEVLLRSVEILILSTNLCPVMNRMTWFWNTSMRSESALVQVIQSKPYKTTGRT